MNNNCRSSIVFLTLIGGLAVSAQAAAQQEGAGPTRPVVVTNGASNPVPVTGALDINGTASVEITNAPSAPVPVVRTDNPDDSPYAEFASATITPPFVNTFLNFPTPPGRRYFIEQASVTCTTPTAADIFTQAQLTVTKKIGTNGTQSFGSPVVVLEKRGPSFLGGYLWTGSANVKVISEANPFQADGSGALYFNIFRTDSTVTANCFGTLFGHSVAL